MTSYLVHWFFFTCGIAAILGMGEILWIITGKGE